MEQKRPDGFILGQDPEAAPSEGRGIAGGGCINCHKEWPAVTFRKLGEAFTNGETAPVKCDSCWPSALQTEIAAKIDEATGIAFVPLTRYVHVEGIESKTNVTAFKYATHIGQKALVVTDVQVWFKGKQVPDEIPPNPCWIYKNVPVAVLEAWYAAPSIGSYFATQIKSSYDAERKA